MKKKLKNFTIGELFKGCSKRTECEGCPMFDVVVCSICEIKEEELENEYESIEIKRYNKRFRIDLQPMWRKLNTHYTEHLMDYLSFNIRTWHEWDRLPITITDKETHRRLIINNENWYEWRKLIKEWLNLPDGV